MFNFACNFHIAIPPGNRGLGTPRSFAEVATWSFGGAALKIVDRWVGNVVGLLDAGAWGGKINGSGGGGCMFAYAAESKVEVVIEAMLAAGAKGAWAVRMDEGVRHG